MQRNSILIGSALASLLSAGVGVATPALAQGGVPTASSTSDTSSNGSSTGVGNAGSFGIGSGTSNGNATATATSNGAVDSHAVTNSTTTTNSDYHGDSHNVSFSGPVSIQDLTASVTGNGTVVSGSYNTGSVMTGGVTLNSGAGVFAGVQTVSINSGVSSANQAATSLGTAGNVSFTH